MRTDDSPYGSRYMSPAHRQDKLRDGSAHRRRIATDPNIFQEEDHHYQDRRSPSIKQQHRKFIEHSSFLPPIKNSNDYTPNRKNHHRGYSEIVESALISPQPDYKSES